MKNVTLLFCALFIMVVASCKKDDKKNADETLTGKWKLDANFISSGGPGAWVAAFTADNSYMQFNTEGNFISNMFPTYNKYTISGYELTLTSTKDVTLGYTAVIKHDTLIINQHIPVACIEGCGIRFIKQK